MKNTETNAESDGNIPSNKKFSELELVLGIVGIAITLIVSAVLSFI